MVLEYGGSVLANRSLPMCLSYNPQRFHTAVIYCNDELQCVSKEHSCCRDEVLRRYLDSLLPTARIKHALELTRYVSS